MKNSPTLLEIACSFDLWMEYADPAGIWSEDKFTSTPVSEKIKTLADCGFTDAEVDE